MTDDHPDHRDVYNALFVLLGLDSNCTAYTELYKLHFHSIRSDDKQLRFTELWLELSDRLNDVCFEPPPRIDLATQEPVPLRFVEQPPSPHASVNTTSYRVFALFQVRQLAHRTLDQYSKQTERQSPRVRTESPYIERDAAGNKVQLRAAYDAYMRVIRCVYRTLCREGMFQDRRIPARHDQVFDRGEPLLDVLSKDLVAMHVHLQLACCWIRGCLAHVVKQRKNALSYWLLGLEKLGTQLGSTTAEVLRRSCAIAYYVDMGEHAPPGDAFKDDCYRRAIACGWHPPLKVQEVDVEDEEVNIFDAVGLARSNKTASTATASVGVPRGTIEPARWDGALLASGEHDCVVGAATNNCVGDAFVPHSQLISPCPPTSASASTTAATT